MSGTLIHPQWERLRGLRRHWLIGLGGFAFCLWVATSIGTAPIDRLCERIGVSTAWRLLLLVPLLLPAIVSGSRLRAFECPSCGRRFVGQGGWRSYLLLRRRCARCGALPR